MTSEVFAQGTDADGDFSITCDTMDGGKRTLRLERQGVTVEAVELDALPRCGTCGGVKGEHPNICNECRVYAHIPLGDW